MNGQFQNWTKKEYHQFQEYLLAQKDENYRKFHEKLTPTKYPIIGIRVPLQRKIAKEIAKGNPQAFLSVCESTYYEEVNIKGFVLASSPQFLDIYFDSFIKEIDNWAICDGFCNSIKITKENESKYFAKAMSLLKDPHDFSVRVGLVLLLSSYVKDSYIPQILTAMNQIHREEYYIKMAIAWLVAECFIKDTKATWPFLKQNQLDKFTQNKTISKIRDSYRVSKEEKEKLKAYRK